MPPSSTQVTVHQAERDVMNVFRVKPTDEVIAGVPARIEERFVVAESNTTGRYAPALSGTISLQDYKLSVVAEVPEGALVLGECRKVQLFLVSRPRDVDEAVAAATAAQVDTHSMMPGDAQPQETRSCSMEVDVATQGLKLVTQVEPGQSMLSTASMILRRSALVLMGSKLHGDPHPIPMDLQVRECPLEGEQVFAWIDHPICVRGFVVICGLGGDKGTNACETASGGVPSGGLEFCATSSTAGAIPGTETTDPPAGEKVKRKKKSDALDGGKESSAESKKAKVNAFSNIFVATRGYLHVTDKTKQPFLWAVMTDMKVNHLYERRQQGSGSSGAKFVYMPDTENEKCFKQMDLVLTHLQMNCQVNIKEELRKDPSCHFPRVAALPDDMFTDTCLSMDTSGIDGKRTADDDGEEETAGDENDDCHYM